MGQVLAHKHDSEGLLIGWKNRVPSLDSWVYTVHWADGQEEDFVYNQIAEHLYSQCDEEGNQYQLFNAIVDHRKGKGAVEKPDQYHTVRGKRYKKKTTAGWELEVEWKGGSTSWVTLKSLKESNPVETAKYVRDNWIDEEPAFDWWVHHILKKKGQLIKASQCISHRQGFKYGIKVPRTMKEALELDEENGNTLWQDSIDQEMKDVMVAFDIKPEGSKPSPGYKCIPVHMVFDVKMDFQCKCRLVAGGHMMDPPKTLTYSSVVSRESVHIAFLLAALMDLDILATDIGNAYLNAMTAEKVYTVTGDEFASYAGQIVVIVRALYGLKSVGASWHAHLAAVLHDMGFQSCLADLDVWLHASTMEDGTKYYEYVLVYIDDILTISKDPAKVISYLLEVEHLKTKDLGTLTWYLGATVG